MKRLTRVLVCAALMASSLIMPVGAWDKYSFVGDDVYFSGQDAVLRPPAVLAEEESSSSWDSETFTDHLSTSQTAGGLFNATDTDDTFQLPDVPEMFPQSGVPLSSAVSYAYQVRGQYFTVSASDSALSDFEFNQILGIAFSGGLDHVLDNNNRPIGYTYVDLSLDISSFGDFSAFELYGRTPVYGLLQGMNQVNSQRFNALWVQVFVNGQQLGTVYGDGTGYCDFAGSVFSVSTNVQSLVLRIAFPVSSRTYQDGQYVPIILFGNSTDNFKFTVLSGESILDGFVDNAQDSINDWDSIESQFGSDATEGFNGLDLDNFTYPSDFLAAFSLVSGIFTDLWNCMGDFQIIYLLPLTLGICLLLVGRVSRSSVPSPPPLHTDLPVSNSLGPPSRPALKGGKR